MSAPNSADVAAIGNGGPYDSTQVPNISNFAYAWKALQDFVDSFGPGTYESIIAYGELIAGQGPSGHQ